MPFRRLTSSYHELDDTILFDNRSNVIEPTYLLFLGMGSATSVVFEFECQFYGPEEILPKIKQ